MPCIGEYNYSFWHSVGQSKESRRNEVSPDTEYWCMDEDGRNVSVLVIGGDLRHLLMSPEYNMFENLARKSPDWVSRIGATQHEAGWLANHSQSLSLDILFSLEQASSRFSLGLNATSTLSSADLIYRNLTLRSMYGEATSSLLKLNIG